MKFERSSALLWLVLCTACGSSAERSPAEAPPVDTSEIARELRARVTRIDCRGRLTCALDADGRLRCWGLDEGTLRAGLDGPARTLAVGDGGACVLDDAGRVRCVGSESTTAVPGGTFLTIQAHGELICGIRDDLGVACWGSPWSFMTSAPAGRFRDLDLANGRACAIGVDGTRVCWGMDLEGMMAGASEPPVRAPASSDVEESVDCGFGTCGRRSDGTIVCSGGAYRGQARPPEGTFAAIASGRAHSCAIRSDGAVACWGADDAGQTRPPAGRFRALTAGGDSTCALDARGAMTCWGAPIPGALDASVRVRTFALASGLGCAITSDDQVSCFGANATNVGFLLEGLRDVREVFVRSEAIDLHLADGTWRCYRRQHVGSAASGVTGTSWAGAPAISCEPFAPLLPEATARAAGEDHVCAIDPSGVVSCRGADGFGQAHAPDGTFRAVAPGDHHTCALTREGSVVCWGSYADGTPL